MMVDISKSTNNLTKAQILDMKTRVDAYIEKEGTPKNTRKIYVDFDKKDSYVTYAQYFNILSRWNSLGQPDTIQIYVTPINISEDDKIIPIKTFLDMEARVNKYLQQGGTITDDRAIFLNMGELEEYITYLKYKDLLTRCESWRKKYNRDPNYLYIKLKTNTNTNRPSAVGDDITPNNDGWYLIQRAKKDSNSIKQETLYQCGPNATQQLLYELTGKWYGEDYISKLEWTTTSGTGHEGINNAILKLCKTNNLKVTINWSYLSDITYTGLAKQIKDIKTGNLQHCKYKHRWGHYEAILGINLKTSKLLVANSLSGGWLEYRSFSTNTSYINGISQKSICSASIT